MALRDIFRAGVSKAPAPETNDTVLTGAFGGAIPRISPTNIANIFTQQNVGIRLGGATSPIAARPNSAPMLSTPGYHSLIPGRGIVNGMPTVPFRRGTDIMHPAAVTDVEHTNDAYGVHPTVSRKVRRGIQAL